MIKTTNNLDVNLLEAEFYESPFNLSYSGLNKLIESPSIFYKEYILKQREPSLAKHLIEGTLIHYLVLEENEEGNFSDKFIIASDNLPSETNRIIANRIFEIYQSKIDEDPINKSLELKDFQKEVLKVMDDVDHYSRMTDPVKRAGKVIEPKTEEYFDFLKTKENKTIIDSKILERCTQRANIVKANPEIRELLGLDLVADGKKIGVYNEENLSLKAEKDMPFGFKGTIDNLVVDVPNKIVRINDFKTTGSSLTDFPESVIKWNYNIQAVMYEKLVKSFLGKVIATEFDFEIRFLVFDKYDQLYPFRVSEKTLKVWRENFDKKIKEAKFHYDSKNYTLPYEYIQGTVEL